MSDELVKVVSPSMGRAGKTKTQNIIANVAFVVPENEAEDYKKNLPDNEVIACPNSIKGIVATRQWMLEKWSNIFMADDDIFVIRRQFEETQKSETNVTDPSFAWELIQNLASITKQMGGYHFGFSNAREPVQFESGKPIVHTKYINNSFMGFLEGHGLEYDLSFDEAEDYYICCMNMYKNRFSVIDQRYVFKTYQNFTSDGGCSLYRTQESMVKNTERLKALFGTDIIKDKVMSKLKKSINKGERTLIFPF
tara:strand:+ start:492 stop:1247 length:756 start_codon:yes stop_codon:yes gene_type:complete